MPTPSLLIVPARFKTGKLYSQIPTSGAGDFTVTRNTEARRFDSAGLVASVASGIPRLDYYTSGGTAGCPALLVEPAGTNQCQRSEEFNNAFWFRSGLNAFGSGSVANTTATLDPYGTNVADYIQEDSTPSTTHLVIGIFSGNVSGTTYTWSVFAKAAERTIINLFNNGGGGGNANFNLITGIATLTAGVSASMQNYGNGWWRCALTYTANFGPPTTGSHNVHIRLCDASGNATYNGTGNQGAYIFGAQLETGSVATSYIPTTAGTGSRSADVISVSGAVSGSIGQMEGTLYAEVDLKNKGVSISRVIYLSDGTSNNEIRISHSATTAGDLQIAIRLAGNLVVNQISPTAVYFGINKIAVGYKVGTNEVVMYVNGSQIILSTSSGNMPACNTIHLGSQLGTSNFLNDRIRAAALYTTRLTNAELATLTTL